MRSAGHVTGGQSLGAAGRSNPTPLSLVRSAGAIAAAVTTAVGLIALVVGAALALQTRHWLHFPFTGLPATPAEAGDIFLHNLRALVSVFSVLLIVQLPFWAGEDAEPGAAHRVLRGAAELVLGAAVLANVTVVGVSLGAYGLRMIEDVAPQAPAELGAYALALALYGKGRSRPLPRATVATVGAVSVALLAVGALLETYVDL